MSAKIGLLQPHQNYVRQTTTLESFGLMNQDTFPALDEPSARAVIGVDRFEY